MLPTDILNHCTDKQVIRNSAAVRVQVAFYAKVEALVLSLPAPLTLGHSRNDSAIDLNRTELQALAMAPRIEIGQTLTDDEVDQLGDYLLKAFMGHVHAYQAANFPNPSKAALAAMHRFNLMF